MTNASKAFSGAGPIKTGRRENPAVQEPRDKTVCFMLSEGEKHVVDRLAFCMHLTRSGILARIITKFLTATENSKAARIAEKELSAYLADCRLGVKQRGAFADKTIAEMKGAE
jgi:hypothetical protein